MRSNKLNIWLLIFTFFVVTLQQRSQEVKTRLVSVHNNNITVVSFPSAFGRCGRLELTLCGHTDSVTCVEQLTHDTLATSSLDSTIRIWNISMANTTSCSTKRQQSIMVGHYYSVYCLKQLSHGRLASGSFDATVKVWQVDTGRLVRTLAGHPGSVYALEAIAHNKLASGSFAEIRLWNWDNGELIATLRGHRHHHFVNALELIDAPPQALLASSSYDGIVSVWRLEEQSPRCVSTICAHYDDSVSALACLSSGGDSGRVTVANAADDGAINVWQVNGSNREPLFSFRGHSSPVTAIAVDADAQLLVSGAVGDSIRVWNVSSGQCLHCSLQDYAAFNSSFANTLKFLY